MVPELLVLHARLMSNRVRAFIHHAGLAEVTNTALSFATAITRRLVVKRACFPVLNLLLVHSRSKVNGAPSLPVLLYYTACVCIPMDIFYRPAGKTRGALSFPDLPGMWGSHSDAFQIRSVRSALPLIFPFFSIYHSLQLSFPFRISRY